MNELATLFRESKQAVVCRGFTDRQLMDKLIKHRDAQSFDALLHRHGSMVWSVCNRIADHPQDAEDAFQVTFLILVKKANTVQPREKVGNWLYGVAVHAARKVRSDRYRRQMQRKTRCIHQAETLVQHFACIKPSQAGYRSGIRQPALEISNTHRVMRSAGYDSTRSSTHTGLA